MNNPLRRVGLFGAETMTELRKAVWPTAIELRDSTIVVFIASLLLGIFVALADFSVYGIVELLTKLVRG